MDTAKYEYLHALGIDIWVEGKPLSSSAALINQSAAPAAAGNTETRELHLKPPRLTQTSIAQRKLTQAEPTLEKPKNTKDDRSNVGPEKLSKTPNKLAQARLEIAWIRIREELVLLADLEVVTNKTEATKLLSNIAQAIATRCGIDLENENPQIFKWPVSKQVHLKEGAINDALRGYIAGKQLPKPCDWIIFGENLYRRLSTSNEARPASPNQEIYQLAQLDTPQIQGQVFRASALPTLLSNPKAKAIIWDGLKTMLDKRY